MVKVEIDVQLVTAIEDMSIKAGDKLMIAGNACVGKYIETYAITQVSIPHTREVDKSVRSKPAYSREGKSVGSRKVDYANPATPEMVLTALREYGQMTGRGLAYYTGHKCDSAVKKLFNTSVIRRVYLDGYKYPHYEIVEKEHSNDG